MYQKFKKLSMYQIQINPTNPIQLKLMRFKSNPIQIDRTYILLY